MDLASLHAQSDFSGMAFPDPWSARLFGLTLALSERGLFTMKEFQAALIETVGDFEKASCISDENAYYTRWLEALDAILRAKGVVREADLSETEKRVVERLLDLQHHRHEHHAHSPGKPAAIAPLLVA